MFYSTTFHQVCLSHIWRVESRVANVSKESTGKLETRGLDIWTGLEAEGACSKIGLGLGIQGSQRVVYAAAISA